ncbi:MAG: bifunctional folylpolyglutamate synthase/dihydrofolate synthase [Acidimicrobiales bacterium]
MQFHDALAYLDEHINLEAMSAGPTAGVVHGLSLDRMRGIVDVLGDPQDTAPMIHITGTNGKGSAARMIAALLGEHGLTVGTYASPHLESITERIRRNAEPISEQDFGEVVGELAAVESLFPDRPSYFDLLTAAAFAWFAREAVDVMVVEVGLLGRYDSTNVGRADVAVITNVGRDHTDGAGDWRRDIAREKAGIIEDGSAVIIGETDPELVEVFRAEGGALHWVRGEHFGVRASRVALGGRQVDLYTPNGLLDDVFLPVHGAHQADNAAIAVAAVEAFFDRGIDHDVAGGALLGVELPGRFEVVSHQPLVVLDGAHNVDGARAFARTVTGEFTVAGDTTLVVGMLDRSDLDDVLAAMLEIGPRRLVCTRPDSPRAVDADRIATLARGLDPALEVVVVDDVDVAFETAVGAAFDDDAVLVAGSLYTVGAARTACRRLGLITK